MSPRMSMNDALKRLRKEGFKCEIMERGTICAHRGESHIGFLKRGGGYSQEAVLYAAHHRDFYK